VAIEFIVPGRTPRQVADAIEQFARAQGHVSALVVPWESTAAMLSVAVTAVKADGWAIEHTNLGTLRLSSEAGGTRVSAMGDPARPDHDTLAAVFVRFAEDVRRRLEAGTEVSAPRDGGQRTPGRRSEGPGTEVESPGDGGQGGEGRRSGDSGTEVA